MSASLIQDYLQTQGLKLPLDEVRAAYAAAQAVINLGAASIDRTILWYEQDDVTLAEHIQPNETNEALLKQVFMALDSTYSRRADVKSAVVYAHLPSADLQSQLICLSRQGKPIEYQVAVHDDNSQIYLASRTAQSGWMNIANDIPYWLTLGEIQGARNTGAMSQISVPICTASGTVLGIVHVEFSNKNQADDTVVTDWTALALALAEPMKTLLGIEDEEKQHD